MGYSNVTVRILPSSDVTPVDDWTVSGTPPFTSFPLNGTTHLGYIMGASDEAEIGFDEYLYLPGYFYSVSDIVNSLPFLQKTRTQSQGRNKTSGIGGYATLKDFHFTIENKDVDFRVLYGRRVEIIVYHVLLKNSPTFPAEAEFYYTGAIQKITQLNNQTLEVRVQGISSINNKRISGTPIIDNSGTQVFNTVILGEGSGVIKLNKTKATGGVQLTYDDSQFEIKDIFVKDTDTDDLLLVKSPWTTQDELIFFEAQTKTWVEDVSVDDSQNKFNIKDNSTFAVRIPGSTLLSQYPSFMRVPLLNVAPDNIDIDLEMGKVGSSVINGQFVGLYLCDQNAIHPESLAAMFGVTQIEDAGTGNNVTVDYVIPFSRTGIDFPYYGKIDFRSALGFFNVVQRGMMIHLSSRSDRAYLDIGKDRAVVIKINGEEMLVLDAVDDYSFAEREITVVRGYNDTTSQAHSRFDDVLILSSEITQRIEFAVRVPCLGFKTLTPHFHTSDDINAFFDSAISSGDQLTLGYVQTDQSQMANSRQSFQEDSIIGLDFAFPSFEAEITSAYFKGNFEIDSLVDFNFATLSTPSRTLSLKLALSAVNDFANAGVTGPGGAATQALRHLASRRRFGFNVLDINSEYYTSIPEKYPPLGPLANDNIKYSTVAVNQYIMARFGTPGKIPGFDIQNSVSAVAMHGAWADDTFPDYEKEHRVGEPDFNLRTLDDLINANIALFFRNGRPGDTVLYTNTPACKIKMTRPYIDLILKVPLKDNEFWASVKSKNNNGSTTITDTFAVGPNASLYLDGNGFLFAESDTIPFIVFQLTATGLLIQKDIATFGAFPEISVGKIGTITTTGRVAKVSNDPTLNTFVYLPAVDVSDPTYPVFETTLINQGSLSYKIVGSLADTNGIFNVNIVGTNIEVTKPDATSQGKVVNLIYKLFTDPDLGDIDIGRMDTPAFTLNNTKKLQHDATVLLQEEININFLIDRVAKEHGLLVFETNDGLVSITDLVPPDPNAVPSEYTFDLTDSSIFFDDNHLPDIEIEFTDTDFLITDLEVRYSPEGNIFKDVINSQDLAVLTNLLNLSKGYANGNEIKVAQELLSVFNEQVARLCAEVKMNYHFTPSRIVTVKCIMPVNAVSLGDWITVSSTTINPTGGTFSYLVIGSKISLPMHGRDYFVELRLYEYDPIRFDTVYQEVPSIPINENYQEDPDTGGDGFDEIPGQNR